MNDLICSVLSFLGVLAVPFVAVAVGHGLRFILFGY
jgi:hypothetical protein